MDIKLTVPFGEDLTKEAGWIQLDRYLYFIARFHLQIEENQTRDFAVGDILRTYRTTPHSETEVEKVFEQDVTTVDLRETTRSAALSNDLTKKIAGTIAGAAKSPFYEVSANIGSALEQTIRSGVTESIRSSDTVSRRSVVHQVACVDKNTHLSGFYEDLSGLVEKLYTNPMSVLSSDTHPKIEQMQIEFIRRMPSWKKFSIVDGLNATVKTLATTGIKQRNPNATPEQIHRMLAALMLGEELARKVYDHAR